MKKTNVIITSFWLLIAIFNFPATAADQADRVYFGNFRGRFLEYASDRVLLKFADTVKDEEAEIIVRNFGSLKKSRFPRPKFRKLSIKKNRVWETIRELQKDPRVVFAHPDWRVYADVFPTDPPNDEFFDRQWNLRGPPGGGIQMSTAWAINEGGNPMVRVAILDTGIAYENYSSFCLADDLNATTFVDGYDFVNNDQHANDDNGHGTHVAGTIAQATNNFIGVAGIAFEVSLMPVKVLSASGSGYISDIAEAIRWATDNDANIINMSLSTSAPRFFLRTLENAVKYAYENGVLMVASSGNNSAANPHYPANYSEVIAVGGTLYDKSLAPYSNRGNEVCAPGGSDTGEDINGDGYPDMVLQNTFNPQTREVCDFGYWYFAGTSMAAPHVSGVAALMLSENQTLSSEDLRDILNQTADNIDEAACGSGLINAAAALSAVSTGDSPPTVDIIKPVDGTIVNEVVTIQISATDSEDSPEQLTVQWNVNNEPTWRETVYNSSNMLYEASWDTKIFEDGTYLIQARATDSTNQTKDAYINVEVNNNNQSPVASFTYECNGSVCSFNATNSYDPDGTIVSYAWDFGDGGAANGETVVHTYTETGTFTVVLTVTDNLGSENTTENMITIDQIYNTLHIGDLDGASLNLFWRLWQATVYFTVQDANNQPVSNATVYGVFDDGSSVYSCSTNSNGVCSVVGYQFLSNCLTYSVIDIAHDILLYQSGENSDPDGDSDGTNITICP